MSSGSLSKVTPTWSSWILACLSTMVTTGARRFVRFQRFRSCFFLHGIKPWILSWPSIWGETTLSPSRLIKMSSLPRSKDSCAALTNLGQIKICWNTGEPSSISSPQTWCTKEKSLSWPRMNFRSCASYLNMRAVSWRAMIWWRSSGIATSLLMTIPCLSMWPAFVRN